MRPHCRDRGGCAACDTGKMTSREHAREMTECGVRGGGRGCCDYDDAFGVGETLVSVDGRLDGALALSRTAY